MTLVKSELDLDTKIFREQHLLPSRHVLVKARQFQSQVAVLEKERLKMERFKDFDIEQLEHMLIDPSQDDKCAIRRRLGDLKRIKACQTKKIVKPKEVPPPKAEPKQKIVMTRNPSSISSIKEALLRWCQIKTRDYESVSITNFSSSWADGTAFCALVHHFFPDAFDFTAITPQNRRHNFELAFRTAQEKADVMPLLDVEDMLMMGNKPDWKCVFTYVQSLYKHFKDLNSPGPQDTA